MKILRIMFENLNSLRGKWQIDLEDKAYTSDGIFAITGSTGAGKTTIFDAICLALYGQTPRLSNISSGSNEIMSRGKSSCCSHVTFSVGDKTYTAKWGQDKKKGDLQTPEHKLEDTDNAIPLTDKNSDTLREVIRLTGMDFKRFTRAMMLEQGHFDSFLTAKKNERAEILELITGTEIYSIISREVYARWKHESRLLSDKGIELEAVKSSAAVMTQEELAAETTRKQQELAALESALKSAGEARSWRRDIRRIEEDIARNAEDIETQQKRISTFEAKRVILDRAERAASIEGEYSRLKASRQDRAKCADDVNAIRQSIAQSEERLAKITAQLPKLSAELESLRHGLSDSPEVVVQRVETVVRDYLSAVHDRKESERRLSEANGKASGLQHKRKVIEAEGQRARALMDEAGRKYDQALREFMELRARSNAAVLDEERLKLRPGEPCPLCGSTEHPACNHALTQCESPQALSAQMDSFAEKLDALKKNLDSAQQEHSDLTDKWNTCSAAISAAMSQASMCTEDLQAKIDRASACHSSVSEAIRPLCFGELSSTDEVIARTRSWAARVAQLEQFIQSAQTEHGKIEAALVAENSALGRRSNDLTQSEEALAELEAAFRNCLAERNFADEKDFVAALPNIQELPALRTEQQELTDRMNALQAMKSNLTQKLADKQALELTPKNLEETEAEYSEREAAVIAAKGNIAALEQKAVEMSSQQARIDELSGEYEAQKLIAQKWSGLSDIVGSAKGDLYRVFAQRITLVLVANSANTYLKRMNGRYTLIPGEDDNLSINVVDSEQAGAVRPTTNLSGGERFIVSLALALGLSQISGSKAMVDSLFLDEGFGSLDEDSLNTALEALAEIHSSGRMIGIISHVAALKERIAAQINVIPKSEGTSILEGPGCSKL